MNELTVLAQDIKREHNLAVTSARTAVEHAKKVGVLLLEAKQTVSHGQWGSWMEDNLPFSARTAQNYMRVSNTQLSADLTIDATLELIAKPKVAKEELDRLGMELRELFDKHLERIKHLLALIVELGRRLQKAGATATDDMQVMALDLASNKEFIEASKEDWFIRKIEHVGINDWYEMSGGNPYKECKIGRTVICEATPRN